jgi:hypothetical protein
MAGLMKGLGTPDITPELKQAVIEGVAQMASQRSVDELAQQENEVLIGLLRLRAPHASITASPAGELAGAL